MLFFTPSKEEGTMWKDREKMKLALGQLKAMVGERIAIAAFFNELTDDEILVLGSSLLIEVWNHLDFTQKDRMEKLLKISCTFAEAVRIYRQEIGIYHVKAEMTVLERIAQEIMEEKGTFADWKALFDEVEKELEAKGHDSTEVECEGSLEQLRGFEFLIAGRLEKYAANLVEKEEVLTFEQSQAVYYRACAVGDQIEILCHMVESCKTIEQAKWIHEQAQSCLEVPAVKVTEGHDGENETSMFSCAEYAKSMSLKKMQELALAQSTL
ncbi:MAG: hypothetical protein WC663_00505 [Patescibacteria group bacterium]|jgi:hypothetical protein